MRFPNQWARKHLRSGDLAVLFRISKRERVNAEPDQIERLMRRSFVKKEADDSLDQPRKAAWPYGSNGFQEADIPLRDVQSERFCSDGRRAASWTPGSIRDGIGSLVRQGLSVCPRTY